MGWGLMASIGSGWVDGAWVQASWVPGAWEGGVPASVWETALLITCITCGKQWEKSDTREMRYFRSTTTFTSYGSPATIVAAGEDMTYCPSCTSGHLAKASEALGGGKAALDLRINPDGLDSERAPTGGADVVHDSTRQTRS